MKLAFGNLSQNVNETELEKIFSEFGEVRNLIIKRDKKTKVSLGYGHLEMGEEAALAAISNLDGKEIDGKKLTVVEASKLQEEHSGKLPKLSETSSKIQAIKTPTNSRNTSSVRKTGGGGRGK
ncbi:MAG: RNA-binding protein [Leptospiraceae bacterium]|nr:RNA-binding protein [Leptospiraceae bacterium]